MIKINQAHSPSLQGWLRRLLFNIKIKMNELILYGNDLYHMRVPLPILWIELTLSKNDAKAIYRALPKNTGLSLRL
jgi:hypothetical protein